MCRGNLETRLGKNSHFASSLFRVEQVVGSNEIEKREPVLPRHWHNMRQQYSIDMSDLVQSTTEYMLVRWRPCPHRVIEAMQPPSPLFPGLRESSEKTPTPRCLAQGRRRVCGRATRGRQGCTLWLSGERPSRLFQETKRRIWLPNRVRVPLCEYNLCVCV